MFHLFGYACILYLMVRHLQVKRWLQGCFLLTLIHICQPQSVNAEGLRSTQKVVLDKTQVTQPYTLKGVCATFSSTMPINIQVWTSTNEVNVYEMRWGRTLFSNKLGRQKIELNETDYYNLQTGDMLGVFNPSTPRSQGPLSEIYHLRSQVLVSLKKKGETNLIPPNVGTKLKFDELEMPYTIPVYLCSTTDCEDCDREQIRVRVPDLTAVATGDTTTLSGPITGAIVDKKAAYYSEETERVLQSTEFMIGILAWNIALTLLIFILLIIIICIISENEKRKKRERSQDQRAQWARAGSISWSDHAPVQTSRSTRCLTEAE